MPAGKDMSMSSTIYFLNLFLFKFRLSFRLYLSLTKSLIR